MRAILSEKEWLVEENGFNNHKLNYYETIFAVGNGYLGGVIPYRYRLGYMVV